MKLTQHQEKIWTITDFLTPQECEDLMLFSETQGYEEATVSLTSGAKMMKGIRNNYRLVYTDESLAKKYWQKLESFCPQHLEDT